MLHTWSKNWVRPEVVILGAEQKEHSKNCDLTGPTPEVRDARTSHQIDKSDWLRIQDECSTHGQKIGSGQRL